jgi:hypothetical protein
MPSHIETMTTREYLDCIEFMREASGGGRDR